MQLIGPSFEILKIDPAPLELIELAGRTCYKTEDRIAKGTAEGFTAMILERGHESVIEHASATVRFIHNRGFTHELVRHRLCSFSQESTRYCNYSKDKFGNELTFIIPYWVNDEVFEVLHDATVTEEDIEKVLEEYPEEEFPVNEACWLRHMHLVEIAYLYLTVNNHMEPQAARGILPNDIKTEIVITANFREWRHIFNLRTSKSAHPDMLRVMLPLLEEFRKRVPVIFDDIQVIK